MGAIKLFRPNAYSLVINKDATLGNNVRAAGDYDNSSKLDFLFNVHLFVPYDIAAPVANAKIGELFVLPGNGATPELFPIGGDGTVGKDVTPQQLLFAGNFEDIDGDTTTDTISGATQANPVVITTSAAHGLANGDYIHIEGVVGMTEINNRNFEIKQLTSTTFELVGEDGTGHTAYTSGGTTHDIDSLVIPRVALAPTNNRFVLLNTSSQTYSAEWELGITPWQGQGV